jgi:molecular chaperone IbpA
MTQLKDVFGRDLQLFDKFFVGFDDHFDRMAKLTQDFSKSIPNYPPCNIRKIDDNKYVIELALAGFSESDVEVTLDGNKLTISGNVKDSDADNFLFKGIANRAFTRSFALADKLEVNNAEMVNGMLKIALDKIIEAQNFKKIEVKAPKATKQKSTSQYLTENDNV